MHPTAHFRSADTALRDRIIAEHGFAAIFLTTPEGPRVAHTPVEWTAEGIGGTLTFHLARSNSLAAHLDGARALAVIHGPDAYISARWYGAANQVPTWNYIAYELEGAVRRLDDSALPALLERLSAQHESRIGAGAPWTMDKLDERALGALLKGIVGFTMAVDTIRETVKLSQNKPSGERDRIIAGLAREGRTAMAQEMREVGR